MTRRRAPRRDWRRAPWLPPLFAVACLGLVGASAWWYWQHSLRHAYPIRYVRIEGKILQLDETELSSAIAPLVQAGFFAVDLAAIESTVRSFPWVGDVRVVRQWPDTLILSVSEHRPAARWNQTSLLSDRGVRFTPANVAAFDTLPVLSGPEGQERELFAVLGKLDAALRADQLHLVTLSLTARQSWTATLSDGKEVAMGRQDPVACFERLRQWLPLLERQRGALVKRVDLRYRNGFAVTWGLGTESAPLPREGGQASEPVAQRQNPHLAALQW